MFSNEERCFLQKNQLGEVICQLRFPDILIIGTKPPAEFQEAIRSQFPIYTARKETPAPKVTGTPGNLSIENAPAIINHQFASTDGVWRVNLTSNFISLACTKYTCWEAFAKHLDKPLAAFIQIYQPAHFQRIGLRYLNFISKRALQLENVPFSQLIEPAYLGILSEEDIPEHTVSRSNIDAELAIRGGCRAKIHAGIGIVKKNGQTDNEAKFIFDQDLFMAGNVPINHSAGALEMLHRQAFSIFRGAITDTLYTALEPRTI